MNEYPLGSVWRKWDLHLHAPNTKLANDYKTEDKSDPLDKFCDELEKSDVQVFGITDYFSYNSYDAFIKRFNTKYPQSKKRFFFNLELRLNETVNKQLEEVNIHLLFNPTSLDKVTKFLSHLKVIKTGKDETPIMCSDLTSEDDFKSATIARNSITEAFDNTYGKKATRQDHFLVFTAANNDGLRPERGKRRKEDICDEIDKFSDGFFGGSQNVNYYLQEDRLEDEALKASKKPVVSGSDSHSFDDLKNFLGNRFVHQGKIVKDVTWIKADPTFEGLKQILYEPEAGVRISIGPVKPDQKDDYKVIQKIKFSGSKDFPEEIVLNGNLCSIIGSRSSGKSALLAYIAHSINPEAVEKVIKGPGEGSDYSWSKVAKNYSIEWANGKSNDVSRGNVIYIPQNYLFDKSKDAGEVKEKIKPVLFKVLPEFEAQYNQVKGKLSGLKTQISDLIDVWFNCADSVKQVDISIKELGDKKAIEGLKTETEQKIEALREKSQLSQEELTLYQNISSQLAILASRNAEISAELAMISGISLDKVFFNSAKLNVVPVLASLPMALQTILKGDISKFEEQVLKDLNNRVLQYKDDLDKEKVTTEAAIVKVNQDNKVLLEKNQSNSELEVLVKSTNNLSEVIRKIQYQESNRSIKEREMKVAEKAIQQCLSSRSELLEGLSASMTSADQGSLHGIVFGAEIGIQPMHIDSLSQKINVRENTDFVKKNALNIETVRNKPIKFLEAIYSGSQKIITSQGKKDVAKNALQLTEEVLFTAEMEGDKIGGFSEPTMTPGKRALFALRLILAESGETWPLLIDQPEDDLDSRSIYNEIVPFLKEKKKSRQIIMVSHNANLVIGSDSEQIIIANRNGSDRKNKDGKQFNYLTGSLEFTKEYDKECEDTLDSQGVCEHTCSILDGGKIAFENRKNRYNIK
jgi:ABC-type cobalamin/Fe3+-siderophores transport system ATPase subunit